MRAAPAFLLLFAACAHLRQPPSAPAAGVPVWRELTSAHFTLWTDLPPAQAREALERLEAFRAVLLTVVPGAAARRPPNALVIAFRSHDEWERLGRPGVLGFFRRPLGPLLAGPLLAYSAERYRRAGLRRSGRTEVQWEEIGDPTLTVQHELGHLIVHSMLGDVPAWLDEGLASYFETTTLDPDTGHAEVGRLPGDLVERARASGLDDLQAIMAGAPAGGRHGQAFHLGSLALVSYLVNEEPGRFAALLRLVQELPRRERRWAWSRIFPEHLHELQPRIGRWLAGGRPAVQRLRLAARPTPARETRLLGEGDVHAIRALMVYLLGGPEKRRLAGATAEAAVVAAPTELLGNLLVATLSGRVDLARARAVAEAHPQEWRAWYLVGVAATDPDERTDAALRMWRLERAASGRVARSNPDAGAELAEAGGR